MGKGDTYRPVDREKYSKSYDRIFSNKNKPKGKESGKTIKK